MSQHTSLSCSSCHSTPDPLRAVSTALKALGIHPKIYIQDNYLQVLVESPDVPDENLLATVIRQALQTLELTSVSTVRIYGRACDQFMPAWAQAFNLGSDTPEAPNFSQPADPLRLSQAVICLP